MGELREHTEDLFKNWVLSDGVVAIQLTKKQRSVSAAEIVRVEFKGYQKLPVWWWMQNRQITCLFFALTVSHVN